MPNTKPSAEPNVATDLVVRSVRLVGSQMDAAGVWRDTVVELTPAALRELLAITLEGDVASGEILVAGATPRTATAGAKTTLRPPTAAETVAGVLNTLFTTPYSNALPNKPLGVASAAGALTLDCAANLFFTTTLTEATVLAQTGLPPHGMAIMLVSNPTGFELTPSSGWFKSIPGETTANLAAFIVTLKADGTTTWMGVSAGYVAQP